MKFTVLAFFIFKLSIAGVISSTANIDYAEIKKKAVNFYDAGKADQAISELKLLTSTSNSNAFFSWLNIAIIEFERYNDKEAREALSKAEKFKNPSYSFYISTCRSIISHENLLLDKQTIDKLAGISDPIEKMLVWQFLYYKLDTKSNDIKLYKNGLNVLRENISQSTIRYAKVLSIEASLYFMLEEYDKGAETLLQSNAILETLNCNKGLLFVKNVERLFYSISYQTSNKYSSILLKYENDPFLCNLIDVKIAINYYKANYFYDNNNIKQSYYFIKKAYNYDNRDPKTITFLAFICYQLKDFKSALSFYNKLKDYPSYKTEAFIGAGKCAYATGNKKLSQYYASLLIKEITRNNKSLNNLNRILSYFYNINEYELIINLDKRIMEKYIQDNPKLPVLASIYSRTGHYLWETGRYEKALEQFQNAIITVLPNENRTDAYADLNYNQCTYYLGLISYLNNKGESFYQLSKQRKNIKEEIRYLKECYKNLNLSVEQIYKYKMQLPSEEQMYLYSDLRSQKYPNIIKVCLELYNLTGDVYYYHQAFKYAEQGRASVMLSMLRSNSGSKIGLIPAKYKKQDDSLNFQISLISQRLTALKDENDAKYTLNTQLDALTVKRSELEQIYKKEYPAFYNLKYSSETVNPAKFKESLAEDECVVEFLLNKNFLISYYIDKKNLLIRTDTLKTVNLAKLADRFYDQTSHFSSDHFKSDSIRQFANDALKLYNILLKPFEDKFRGKKLIIVADNELRKISFEVLLTHAPTDLSGYKNLPYLIKKHPVYYAPSATFLNELRQRPVIKSRARLLAVAPVYSSLKLNDTISRMLLAVRADTSIFGSLPNAKKEVMFAHSLAGGRYLSERKASETRFKKMAGNFDIIHLATHGILNNEASLQSNLLFADSQPEDDGFLYNYEIYNLKQSSQLVILSACNTGAGKNFGGEGIISTGRGFLSSGSRSVVMTLWPVNDQASFELIKGFYTGLKQKLPICEALQQSKISYLNGSDNLHSHPFFWTGYVIYGDASIQLPVGNYTIYYIIAAAGVMLLIALLMWKFRSRIFRRNQDAKVAEKTRRTQRDFGAPKRSSGGA